MPQNQTHIPDLPEDVVLSVRGVSKKFCRNLRRSMWYGIQDLAGNLLGVRGKGEGVSGNALTSCHLPHPSPVALLPLTSFPLPQAPLRRDEFWALRDISFDLKRGECLGLIGRNGCGKTTLLRLIAGIFPPDQGEIAIRGRVGALIALGAGFHPHMTGRENVYLNGTILGLHRKEIDAQFDEIVDFAEIGEFIDAPVSTYSSGMKVRLGFAVATAIKPDLLIIDEVLAVGDLSFKQKCMGVMEKLLENSAAIFVSHSMMNVARISTRVLLMNQGCEVYQGDDITHGILTYFSGLQAMNESSFFESGVSLEEFSVVVPGSIVKKDEQQRPIMNPYQPVSFRIKFLAPLEYNIMMASVIIYDAEMHAVSELFSRSSGFDIQNRDGYVHIEAELPGCMLNPGIYSIHVCVWNEKWRITFKVKDIMQIAVVGSMMRAGSIQYRAKWHQYERGS